jgi:L-amino acid N-acyltransferase
MATAYATNGIIVRDAESRDLDVVHELHVESVLHTNAAWQDEPDSRESFDTWLAAKREHGFPVLVAEVDGETAGYVSYGPWRDRIGYRHTVENSVYVLDRFRGRGIATVLMRALLEHARAAGIHVVMAGISSDNTGSIALHERLGFRVVGVMPEVGVKFGRWLDLTMMQLTLPPR